MKITYYQLKLKLCSPLALSGGSGELTDSDCLRNSEGTPFIPGSAVAGLLRSKMDNKTADTVFGFARGEESEQSKVFTYDAFISGEFNTSVRDSVALDGNKISRKGAKFDFEVVETGAEFLTYLEVRESGSEITDKLEKVLLKCGTFCMGAKNTRGYGVIALKKLCKRVFDISVSGNAEEWLDSDLFSDSFFENTEVLKVTDYNDDFVNIKMTLRCDGAPMIRKYTTDIKADGTNQPDARQLMLKSGDPVIPGTTWAGAFRHHMSNLLGEMNCENKSSIEKWFGYAGKEKDDSRRSGIIFCETVLKNAVSKVIIRNSIDRFSGGTSDTALFTEECFYNGSTVLSVDIQKELLEDSETVRAFVYTLCDLNCGILAVGGETSAGHGIFHIEDLSVNGKSTDTDASTIISEIKKCREA